MNIRLKKLIAMLVIVTGFTIVGLMALVIVFFMSLAAYEDYQQGRFWDKLQEVPLAVFSVGLAFFTLYWSGRLWSWAWMVVGERKTT